jgi:hypothetical protein
MSDQKVRKLARAYMNEQKKILKEYGDSVVQSKYNEAVVAVERIFREIANKPKASAQAKS